MTATAKTHGAQKPGGRPEYLVERRRTAGALRDGRIGGADALRGRPRCLDRQAVEDAREVCDLLIRILLLLLELRLRRVEVRLIDEVLRLSGRRERCHVGCAKLRLLCPERTELRTQSLLDLLLAVAHGRKLLGGLKLSGLLALTKSPERLPGAGLRRLLREPEIGELASRSLLHLLLPKPERTELLRGLSLCALLRDAEVRELPSRALLKLLLSLAKSAELRCSVAVEPALDLSKLAELSGCRKLRLLLALPQRAEVLRDLALKLLLRKPGLREVRTDTSLLCVLGKAKVLKLSARRGTKLADLPRDAGLDLLLALAERAQLSGRPEL